MEGSGAQILCQEELESPWGQYREMIRKHPVQEIMWNPHSSMMEHVIMIACK